MKESRRTFCLGLPATMMAWPLDAAATESGASPLDAQSRCAGLLWGTLLGDAMGGPLEFAAPEKRSGRVVDCRAWPKSKRLDHTTLDEVRGQATLMSYEDVRPDTAAYGQWTSKSPAGTLTDDSRLKIILIRAFRRAAKAGSEIPRQEDIAREILDFTPYPNHSPDKPTAKLLEEGMREYRYAARWILGERGRPKAFPLERLWAGVPNCSGQMMLLPLALWFAGQPEQAYDASYFLNFVDAPEAKDITSAIIAGLASVLGQDMNSATHQQRWAKIEDTMRSLDPFRYRDVPFVGRPMEQWLDLSDSILERAEGRPAVAYRLLETEGKPVYFWDSHFTLLVAFTLLKLTDCDAMASLSLAIDFGHDTDSYAQLIGAIAGAVSGTEVFPAMMRETVAARLRHDFDEEVDDWMRLLTTKTLG
ncbi:MAG: ADP-ribosylglycohydrolase family protein [Planctomycetota bacterium]